MPLGFRAPAVLPSRCWPRQSMSPPARHACSCQFSLHAHSAEEIRLLFQNAGVERLELEPAGERGADDLERLFGRRLGEHLQWLAVSCCGCFGKKLDMAGALHGDEPPG